MGYFEGFAQIRANSAEISSSASTTATWPRQNPETSGQKFRGKYRIRTEFVCRTWREDYVTLFRK